MVFLKGCNLNCKWCHNPESINKDLEIMFNPNSCIRCGLCKIVCGNNVHTISDNDHVIERNNCNLCGKCIEVCPTKSIEICGKFMSLKEIIRFIDRDEVFYNTSKGGLTISGGEPLTQKDFTYSLLKEAKSLGIHTVLDTNGYYDFNEIKMILNYIDIIHYDLKIMDSDLHEFYTGTSNKKILETLKKICIVGKNITITIPLIEGVNNSERNINETISFLENLSNKPRVKLLPYHHLYISKLLKLGKNGKQFKTPSNIKEIMKKFEVRGFELYKNYLD